MPKIAFAELKTQYSRSSLAAGTNLGSPQQNRASHQAPLKRNRFAGDTKNLWYARPMALRQQVLVLYLSSSALDTRVG